ncbi:MAG: hypothetical protein ACLGPM_00260 [Acidobacteriota bacterium]
MLRRILFLGLLAGVFAAVTPLRAETDTVQFLKNIHVMPGAPINDGVCFFCDVRADGPVNGDLVVFFGSVRINGQTVSGDVVDFFGTVRVEDNSSVMGDVVHIVGPTHLGNNVFLGSDLTGLFSNVQSTLSTRIVGDRMVIPEWVLLVPLFFAILVVALIAFAIQARRRPRLVYPPR